MSVAGSQARHRADKIGDMRKLVAIFLLSLLSLQTSWAAVASYCQHEQGASARHLGHHDHQHQAQHQTHKADPANPIHNTALPGAITADADCGLCQAGFLTALMIDPVLPVASFNVGGLAEPVSLRPSSAPLDLPERPNWS